MHPMPTTTIPVQIKEIIRETSQIKRFVLAPSSGGSLPSFSGGAHITTYFHYLGSLMERNYSLIGNPNDREKYQVAVRLQEQSRGGSTYWHDQAQVGDQLEISYPRNHFPLSFRAKRHVFYAAGIGITPFLSMMAELAENGQPFELHYAARTQEECAFYPFLQARYPDQCYFYFSSLGPENKMSPALLDEHPMGTHVYFCGPSSMIEQYTEYARSLGYPQGSIHSERFAPLGSNTKKAFLAVLGKGNTSVEVPETQSLLEALLMAGVKAPYSCRVGSCGTCQLDVLEGEIDHNDSFLTEEERSSQNVILSCVSRARSGRLVLDI
jgi:ferredoxin-NADP reductase